MTEPVTQDSRTDDVRNWQTDLSMCRRTMLLIVGSAERLVASEPQREPGIE